jgi:NhaA family Na+:H+ antiporter
VGELRNPRQAMLPISGALGGMIVPALVCLAVAWGAPGVKDAWPVPVATDIAFALAVLAITARDLPASLRVFLLSLAIVDDLGAILLIAVLFTSNINVIALLGAVAAIGVYIVLQRFRVNGWWIYVPLALLVWVLTHESGIHATVAGVAIGLATRVKPDRGERKSPAEILEHRLQPISAGICVPLFAFFAAGIPFSLSAIGAMFSDRAALGVLLGLLIGKTIGVFGAAVFAVRAGLAKLPESLHWLDLAAVAVLTGCGFTVSLLIAELAFPQGSQQDSIKAAVLVGSLAASLIAAALLRRRAQAHNG